MKQSFEIMPEEYWWGGFVHNGHRMPYSAGSKERIDLAAADNPNQAASLFLSSKGRVIYSDKPFVITFDNNIDVEGQNIRLLDGFVNLKGAYLAAAEKTMNFTGQIPDKVFFMKPQYNTWIELTHFQTQTGVLKYARRLTRKDGMEFLSQIMTGITDGILTVKEPCSVYGLMIGIQPANLLSLADRPLDKDELDAARAEFLRKRLPEIIEPEA